MRPFSPLPPDRVPTLTEVVPRPRAAAESAAAPEIAPPAPAEVEAPAPSVETRPPTVALRLAEEQIIHGVLAQLQRQVDLMLEYRIREILTPLLERAADGVVRDARAELASTLRDLVARAVADELAKHRSH